MKPEARKSQLHARELIPADTRFSFEVDTEPLGDAALGLLVLALEPARLCRLLGSTRAPLHKIGGGKPLGMGSAELTITSAAVVSARRRYTSLAGDDTALLSGADLDATLDGWARAAIERYGLTLERTDLSALLTLLDWDAIPDPRLLRYPPGPTPETEHESFQWFMEHAFSVSPRRPTGPRPRSTIARNGGTGSAPFVPPSPRNR